MYGCPAFTPDGPVDSAALPLRKTDTRNGVTPPALSAWSMAEQAPAARAGGGRMVQEANALGKAQGYADVDHDSRNVELPVGVETS